MGFFGSLVQSLLGGGKCPACGTPGARTEGSQVRCLNPFCQNFDPNLKQGQPVQPPQPPSPEQPSQQPPSSGQASGGSVTIHYRNFQNQDKAFTADASSLYRKRDHIMARVAPNGVLLSLSRKRIQNLQEVEGSMLLQRVAPGQDWPTRKERQVMGYHQKHGTTSPLYEKIRAKYPRW